MKSKLYLLLPVSLLCLGACKSDPVESPATIIKGGASSSSFTETNFNVQFRGGYCGAISEYTDNGNLAVGKTSDDNIQIIKVDNQGNKVWEKIIGGSGYDAPRSIVGTTDHAYLVAGYSLSADGDFAPLKNLPLGSFILKIDLLGNIVWVKRFGPFNRDGINHIIKTTDNAYIATTPEGFIKIDKDGNVLWTTTFEPSDPAGVFAVKMIQDKNCDLIVVGWTRTSNFWVAKYNQKGKSIWEKTYGGPEADMSFAITADRDNNYVIVGTGQRNNPDAPLNHGLEDAWFLKVNQDGNKIWSKTLGGSNSDNITSIITLSNGQYLAAGWTSSIDFDLASFNLTSEINKGWLLKINADGTLDSHQICHEGEFHCIGKGEGDNYLIGGLASTEEKPFWVLSIPAP